MFLFKNNVDLPKCKHLNQNIADDFQICNDHILLESSDLNSDEFNVEKISLDKETKTDEMQTDKDVDLNLDEVKDNIYNCDDDYSEEKCEDEDEDGDGDGEVEDSDDDDYDESQLFVLSIDNTPFFYEKDLEKSRDILLQVARKLNQNNNRDYRSSYIRENDILDSYQYMNLNVVRHFDFIYFKYDYNLHSLKIHKIKQYK